MISAHVDDLKGCGEAERVATIIAGLESEFGKMKISHDSFMHCGLLHTKTATGYTLSQEHYAQQLRCIDTTELNLDKPDTPLNPDFISRFQSLLGGLSWLIQTRADICVYVTALQRAASKATVAHVIKINKLTKWVRRKRCALTYNNMSGSVVLACIRDSAFKTEPGSSVALRGALIGVLSTDGTFHLVEYCCRKQRRVCRSTFAAEINALADAAEIARLINFTITHLYNPRATVTDLLRLEETGKLPVKLHCFTDCRSVFDTLSASDLRTPSESSLVLIVAMLRELLELQVIGTLSWVDTADMLADGLTKGLVSRKALLHTSNSGVWKTLKPSKSFSVAEQKQKTESANMHLVCQTLNTLAPIENLTSAKVNAFFTCKLLYALWFS